MAKKFRLLLLDADVVIEAFRQGVWDKLAELCGIHLSRIVADEAHFWTDDDGERHDFDLQQYVDAGKIEIVEVKPSDLSVLCAHFDPTYLERLHAGETESLAYLLNSEETFLICSADKVVYRVLGNLNKADQGISWEEILQQVGLGRPLSRRAFSRAYREQWTLKGAQDQIQNRGWSSGSTA